VDELDFEVIQQAVEEVAVRDSKSSLEKGFRHHDFSRVGSGNSSPLAGIHWSTARAGTMQSSISLRISSSSMVMVLNISGHGTTMATRMMNDGKKKKGELT
jgi:hypothetical protein